MRTRRLRTLAATVGVLATSCWVLAVAPTPASASANQLSIIQDSPRLLADPSGTLATVRALGANMVRVVVVWAQIAPDFEAAKPPRGFDAADPADYPESNWAPYDAIVKQASADGIAVDFTLSGGAPRWAEGPGIPLAALDNLYWAWKPSAQGLRAVRPGGRRALQRHLRAAGEDRSAAAGELLGDLERAELRRGPGAPGDQRLDGVGGTGHVPQPGRTGLERPAGHRAQRGHDPVR